MYFNVYVLSNSELWRELESDSMVQEFSGFKKKELISFTDGQPTCFF